jgi:hypothetical protein
MLYKFADSLRANCQQTRVTYTIVVCTVKNSSDTYRIKYQEKFEKLVRLVGFIIRYLYFYILVIFN